MAKKGRTKGQAPSAPNAPTAKTAAKAAPPPPLAWSTRLGALGLATLSGILLFTSCASFDMWWNAWFALVPTLWLIDRADTPRRAMLAAWWCGIVANAGGFYWIIGLLERFAHLPWIAAAGLFLLLSAYQAVVFLLFGRVVHRLRRTTNLPMVVIAPLTMVAFELVVPMIFPWYLAITQAWQLPVIQIADLTGPLGVTALLLIVNGALYDVIRKRRAAWPSLAGAAAIVALALVYGQVRLGQVAKRRAAAPKLTVGVIQPNVSFDEKGLERRDLAERQLGDLQTCSAAAERAGAELLVWTESSYPSWISRRATSDVRPEHPARIRRGFTVPLLLGAVTYDPAAGDTGYPYNSALMLDQEGRFTGRFDKIFLLMFGEYIPGLETFPFIRKWLPRAAGHFARGKEVSVFPYKRPSDPADAPPWRLAPLICYEDIIPSFGRKLAKFRPHLLVNITNDAWFGATSEPWEHLQLAVYRSVELRTEMVRSVNTGVSAFIDAGGRVYRHTYSIDPAKQGLPPGRTPCGPHGTKADMEVAEMALMEGGHTVYAAVGDVFGIAMALACAFLWLVWPRVPDRMRPAWIRSRLGPLRDRGP
jgi:apolipoprotein N-acyltransferase